MAAATRGGAGGGADGVHLDGHGTPVGGGVRGLRGHAAVPVGGFAGGMHPAAAAVAKVQGAGVVSSTTWSLTQTGAELAFAHDAWAATGALGVRSSVGFGGVFLILSILGLGASSDGTTVALVIALRVLPAVVLAVLGALAYFNGYANPTLRSIWSPVAATSATLVLVSLAVVPFYCSGEGLGTADNAQCWGLSAGSVPWLPVMCVVGVPYILTLCMLVRWHHATIAALLSAVAHAVFTYGKMSESPAGLAVFLVINTLAVAAAGRQYEQLLRTLHLATRPAGVSSGGVGTTTSSSPSGGGAGGAQRMTRAGQLLDAVDTSGHMFVHVDLDGADGGAGTLTLTNNGCKALLGYDRTELEGGAYLSTVAAGDRDRVAETLNRALQSPLVPFQMTFERVMLSGAHKKVRFSGLYACSFDKPRALVGWEWDEDLASRRGEAAKLAKDGEDGTGGDASAPTALSATVLGLINHELKNSLHALDATVDTLSEEPSIQSEFAEDIDDIISATKNIELLVSDVLALVKLRDVSLITHPEVVNIRELVDRAVGAQKALTRSPVLVSVDAPVPRTACLDGSLVSLMLTNGLASALRHSSADADNIRLNVSLSGPTGQRLHVEVIDAGELLGGQTEDSLVGAVTAGTPIQGVRARYTALVMHVCREVAKALVGDAHIEEDGGFVRFWFDVPFTSGTGSSSKGGDAEAKGGAGGAGRGKAIKGKDAANIEELARACKGMYVLLVDDVKILRRQGEHMLSRLGCKCVLLEDAGKDGELIEKALRDNTQQPFDAILLDIVMKFSDGAEVCKKLRKIHGAKLPIIAMTSHNEPGDQDRFMAMGFDLILPKPFNVEQMGNALLKGRQVRGTGRFRHMSALDAGGRLSDAHRHGFTASPDAIAEAEGDLPDDFGGFDTPGAADATEGRAGARALPGASGF